MAELEDWTCEFGGLVMGAPGSPISIVAVDGLLSLPDVRSSDLTLVQRHGLYAGDDYMNGRSITLTLEVYGATREEFTASLSAVYAAFQPAQVERPLRFRFPGVGGDLAGFVNVRPRKRSGPLDLNFAYQVCNVVVEFFATDPYIYGDTLTSLALSAPWQGSNPKLNFTQPGSVNALPVIKLVNAKDCVITDELTGQWFGMTNLAGGLTIDSERQTVTSTASGTNFNDRITPGSTWPEFKYGAHRLAISTLAVNAASTATITWRNRWA
ncbi:phage tail family protein [Streptomyces sp. DK15]|uniref:phage tail domain-containing protein n=1 Tax=Streptomyces sp. DK15 TaxID=2957499 RepID=UPI0029B16F94|nr:phage tail domain-containing protein [Streptomyces sp. DK15]MDX2390189.1 phage tail family protein [Streptomyces sp. DK15]